VIRRCSAIYSSSKLTLLYIFFVALLLSNISSHELWRDETDAWLVARDSTSIRELLSNVRNTGRPPLWYLLLYGASHVNEDILLLQVMTFLISASALSLVVFVMEGTIRKKLFLLSGFYFLFGFSVLSRDYSLILLLVISLFIVYRNNRSLKTRLKVILMICIPLSSINIFGILVVLAILTSITLSVASSAFRIIKTSKGIVVLSAVNLAWLLVMISISLPPKDHVFSVYPPYEVRDLSYNSLKIIFWKSIGFFAQVVFPFWENFQVSHLTTIPALIGFVLLVFLVRNLERELKLVAVCSITFFYLFHIFGYSPFWWHRGTLTIVLVLLGFSLLIDSRTSSTDIGKLAVTIFLLIQVAGSFFGLGRTFWGEAPYSNAENASVFISTICAENKLIVAESDLSSSAISAYLPDFSLFYLNRERFGTFTSWKASDWTNPILSWMEVESRSGGLSPCAYILLGNSPIQPPAGFSKARFLGSIWGDNYLIVYR